MTNEDKMPFERIPLTIGEARRKILRLCKQIAPGVCAWIVRDRPLD